MNINRKNIFRAFEKTKLSEKSKDSYLTCITIILQTYDDKCINNIIRDNSDMLFDRCITISDKPSTQKSYLCAFLKLFTIFELDESIINKFSDAISKISKTMMLKKKIDNQTKPKEDINEAIDMIKKMTTKYYELKLNVVASLACESGKALNGVYNKYAQLAAICYIMFNYGVLRGDEFMSIVICDNDNHEAFENYINIDTAEIVINKHKSMHSMGTKRQHVSDELIDIVKHGYGKHLIVNSKGEPFKTSKDLSRFIHSNVGEEIYTYRKAFTSMVLRTLDDVKINKVARFQGHSVGVQLDYYLTYA